MYNADEITSVPVYGAPMDAAPEEAPKRKSRAGRQALKIVGWLLVIALVLFLVLFLASKIGQFQSIPAMLRYIRAQF